MRIRRKAKTAQADVLPMQMESIPTLTNSAASEETTGNLMRDDVYYHHWMQMMNVWPYL